MDYEMIMGYEGLPFKLLIHGVNKRTTHWHDNIEILFILEGSLEVRIAEHRHMLKKDDLFIINSKEIHNVKRTSKKNLVLLLQLDLRHYSRYYPEFKNMIFDNDYFIQEENLEIGNNLKQYMAKMVWQLKNSEAGYPLRVASDINLFLAQLIKNTGRVPLGKERLENTDEKLDQIKGILDYIDKNLENGITLNDIAKKLHYSNAYLSRFFKDMMGISFQEYIDYMRLERASELLLGTDKFISEIANKIGVANPNTLNRLFREHYDVTPTEFRNQHKDLSEKREKQIEKDNRKSLTYFDVNRTSAYRALFKYLTPNGEKARDPIENSDVQVNPVEISTGIEKTIGPFSTYWKKLTTFGRAAEGLRSDVQKQLRLLQRDIGFKYIRFHGIFSDDMMVCHLDEEGNMQYDWSYIDKLFDFFKEVHIKPFVGLSFMPSELKSSDHTMFWWSANISQPKDIELWKDLISNFIKHCINRYGLEEVESWYFEVWNEPELEHVFWIGDRQDYFNFYAQTVSVIKSISRNLKVGGPAITSEVLNQGDWLDDFLKYCFNEKVCLDFISVHIYPEKYAIDFNLIGQMDIAANLGEMKDPVRFDELLQIKNSMEKIYLGKENTKDSLENLSVKLTQHTNENLEIHVTEWNASSQFGNLIHDTCLIANYIIHDVIGSLGKTDSLGYWVFTDIMEEIKIPRKEFYGGFGLMTANGLKKPSYFAYEMLNKLGDEIISIGEEYIITKKKEDVQILLYNYAYFNHMFLRGDSSALLYKQRDKIFEEKSVNEVNINLSGIDGTYRLTKYKLDQDHGSVYDNWIKMGSPENMSKEEIHYLRGISQPKITVESLELKGGYKDKIFTKVHGLDLIILEKKIQ